MANLPIIAIVDDDIGMREALDGLIQSMGFRAVLFESAEDYLASAGDCVFACIVVDVCMPGLSGLELQTLLNRERAPTPMIFMTSHIDEFTRLRALAGGARYFLGKPVGHDVFVDCLKTVVTRN